MRNGCLLLNTWNASTTDMRDWSIIVIGDCFFTNLLKNLTNRSDRGEQIPVVITAKGASVSLLAELERFISGRSLLIVHLGSWDVSRLRDARDTAEKLADSFRRLRVNTPDLTIIVYKLSQRRQGFSGLPEADRIEQYNLNVNTFNEHLQELLHEMVTISSFELDSDRHLGNAGWCPNYTGNSIIAEKVSGVIREHRRKLPSPTYTSMSLLARCDTLIIGDRLFAELREYLPDDVGDTAVVTAWSAWSCFLEALTGLVGRCHLKLCIIYLGLSDIFDLDLSYDPNRVLRTLHNSTEILKKNNAHCRVVVCLLEKSFLPRVDQTVDYFDERLNARMNYYRNIRAFNRLLLSYHNWEIQILGLHEPRPDPETVARRVSNVIRLSRPTRRPYPEIDFLPLAPGYQWEPSCRFALEPNPLNFHY